MARPALNEEEKRTVQVNIRLTINENDRLVEQAESSGMSPANWIRHKVFTGKYPAIKASPVEASLYRELHHIGNNLNQAVKQTHAGKLSPAFLNILRTLLNLKTEILKKLLG